MNNATLQKAFLYCYANPDNIWCNRMPVTASATTTVTPPPANNNVYLVFVVITCKSSQYSDCVATLAVANVYSESQHC